MHLKSLTLRGFKSFAASTTLHFEPGITCVVGPNGSGKSNVVDALAWVLGEQGAKSLRGGKMEDVIFAGTAARPPLGRAEVLLTIDNADGVLPVEYTEVTISRTMFRGGGSEYAINGQPSRLLDVQELLSDSGIGREMHVIVGQGQLDAILQASPEERRGFVEEAAGVVKHRKRKEKALRKLDATGGNLARLQDLLTEIRRQLKPLGRQAEVARQAAVIQADARDARARLLADDLVEARGVLRRELAEEDALRERRTAVEAALAAERDAELSVEELLGRDAPQLTRAQETWYELSGLRERLQGTRGLAVERSRHLDDEPVAAGGGRDPAALEAEADLIRAEEDTTAAELSRQRIALDQAVRTRRAAEAALVEEESRITGLLAAAADHREGLARLTGQVDAGRSRAAAADDELRRLTEARQSALDRAAQARRDFTALETTVAGLDSGERGLDAEHEAAQLQLDDLDDRLAKIGAEAQAAERERAALGARKEALQLGLAGRDAAGALLAAGESVPGLLGSLADLISVRPGCERAVAAALASAADAVAVSSLDAALDVVAQLKASDGGRASFVLASRAATPDKRAPLPTGATYAADVVTVAGELRSTVHRLLADVAVVADLPAARSLRERRPDVVAVTREGDVVGRCLVAGGSSAVPTRLELHAALEEAVRQLAESTHHCERLRFDVSRLADEQSSAQRRVDVALAKLHESDAAMAAVAEELAQWASLGRTAQDEAARLQEAIEGADSARAESLGGLAELDARLRAAQVPPANEPATDDLERLRACARSARHQETDARLAVRTVEERSRSFAGRADALLRGAAALREEQRRARARVERRAREIRIAASVATAADEVLARLERSLRDAAAHRGQVESDRAAREQRRFELRTRVRDLSAEVDRLTDSVHRDEVARAEQRMRVEQLSQRALDELGLDPDSLVDGYGPDRPVLVPRPDGPDQADLDRAVEVPYVREEQEKRLRTAEQGLAVLGRVNPLALEEFGALEERHKFLTEQLEDLRKTRTDLLAIIRDVDERVEQVLSEAYRDTAREFAAVFSRLFPGGEGRLVLTEPSDLLASGIDVEARPPGKKVKRLSLLSGGERSLVAVAFLIALFKARPSPFYILDEVEAALDDTNLGRLLEIYEELREESQLLVITHQKRTMEVADALYGVSMRGDGVSAVISQRLREAQPA